jgi:1,4-alpha-glucan branching enzyme
MQRTTQEGRKMDTRRSKKTKRATANKPVTLCCRAPTAQTVFVTGTFNEWHPDATPMIRGDNGEWTVELDISPGRYEFKFVVDGQWCCEPGTDDANLKCECVSNPFGTMNRVLDVALAA